MHDHVDCEEKLWRVQNALIRAEQLAMAGRFAGGVMHEVNNPLEAIGNLVYLANQQADDPAMVREYLSMAGDQLSHVQDIARRTLSFYRSYQLHGDVDLLQVLDAALQMQRPQLLAKSIEVHRVQPGAASLKANPGELLQVFTNLISNSVDALPDGGALHVRVSRSGEHVHILVADNGRGIPEGLRQSLFEPFASGDKDKGTGLGLWMSRALVEKHRGKIRHRSSTQIGRRGTAFRVSLPR